MVNRVPEPRAAAPAGPATEPTARGINPAAASSAGSPPRHTAGSGLSGPTSPKGGARATAHAVKAMAAALAAITTRPWTLMEVCGGQTHAIVRWGLDQLLPGGLRLIHGPGCPVCVTPAQTIEEALQLARRPEVILCSYGDMLRVPGEGRDTLLSVRASGGDVRLLTAPLQALELARSHPDRLVVFLAVGFETTAPATALLARQALALGLRNLSLLAAHVRVSPAMEAILAEPGNRVQGFLAAGHVCSVLGTAELEQLVGRRRVPVVVSGFEPAELMAGILACVRQLESGEAQVENAYGAVVRAAGNPAARRLLAEVFEPCDRPWRGLGVMAGGGLALRGPYRALDAVARFGLRQTAGGDGTGVGAIAMPAAAEAPAMGGSGLSLDTAAARQRIPKAERHLSGEIAAAEARAITPAADSEGPTDGRRTGIGCSEGTPPGGDGGLDPAESCCLAPIDPGTAAQGSGHASPTDEARCIAGAILRGQATPEQCLAFGSTCTPERPLGAPMVSSEGACAAYFLYRRRAVSPAKESDQRPWATAPRMGIPTTQSPGETGPAAHDPQRAVMGTLIASGEQGTQ